MVFRRRKVVRKRRRPRRVSVRRLARRRGFKRSVRRVVKNMAETKTQILDAGANSTVANGVITSHVHLPLLATGTTSALSYNGGTSEIEFNGLHLGEFGECKKDSDEEYMVYPKDGAISSGVTETAIGGGCFLADVSTGSRVHQRVGNKIFLKGLKAKLILHGCASDGNNIVRCSLIRYKRRTGWNNNVLPPYLAAPWDTNEVEVLWDEKFVLNRICNIDYGATPDMGPGVQKRIINRWFPINRTVVFDSNVSTSLLYPKYYFFAWSDSAVPPGPTMTGRWIVYFKDI